MMNPPSGVRNNDPGSIDYSPPNQLQGQLAPDPEIEKRFAWSDTVKNGIRALAKLVLAYRGKYVAGHRRARYRHRTRGHQPLGTWS